MPIFLNLAAEPDRLRDLARRARRLAGSQSEEAERRRLEQHAAELELEALQLEPSVPSQHLQQYSLA